ncbi:MAG: glycosyltransferase family 4 protein [Lachnospiraceae bacterium]|nr:glycosyltransferase family 4 protein [Lachnospiraceae bacterium]
MKIAMIGHKRIPSREGGIEIVVEELAVRMAAQGHQVDVYNRKGKNVADAKADLDAHKLKEYKGVRLIWIPTFEKKSLNAIVYAFNATIRALFGHYDVIHYHAEGPCAMLPIAHLFGIRTVATIHGLDWQRAKWGGFATKFLLFGEKMAAKYADEIIVLSKNVQKYFKETYNRDTNYIPNGVNIPEPKEPNIITKKYGLEKDSYILFLARIVPEKGLHYLIEAYKGIQTDKKLVIAGGASHSGEYMHQIEEMVKGQDNIVMTGFVQGEELEELFSNCFLYVLPSDVEGMPISLLEAMSYGRQCLVSDIEENVEVLADRECLFRQGNVNDLQKRLFFWLKQNHKVDFVDYSIILNRYNWIQIIDKTLVLYEHECKEKRGEN